MAKKILKRVVQWSGVDVKRYDKRLDLYQKLFNKYSSFTMVPEESFVDNLHLCDSFKSLSGDYVECGVWRGGMSAAMSEILGKKRIIHLFDSFEGLPPAKEIDGQEAIAWQKNTIDPGFYDNCTADESFAREAMKLADHQNYKLYRGWFQDTLSSIETKSIAILRLDGDWYDSIKICLDKLFPLVVSQGIILIDDYYAWDGCSKAVHDYLSHVQSPSRVYQWNGRVAYIVKKD